MNIELRFTIDEIGYVKRLIDLTRNVQVVKSDKNQLFLFSIVLDIGLKMDKKDLALESVFPATSRKRYKMKFKYHEASILEQFILNIQTTETDPYCINMARSIANQLNQKLA